MKLRRTGAPIVAALAVVILVSTPVSAGYGTLSGEPVSGCVAAMYNDSNKAITARITGSCSVMTVRLELRAHTGGNTFWTAWKYGVSHNSTVQYDRPNQTTVVKSRHGVQYNWAEKNLLL